MLRLVVHDSRKRTRNPIKRATIWLLTLGLTITGAAKDDQKQRHDANAQAVLEIHLRDLGYQHGQEGHPGGTEIPRDLSTLNDDDKKRLAFIDDKTLIVYQSQYQPQSQKDGIPESRSMEAFFVNPQTGVFISRKSWPTIKRRWLNERWDTQARIIAVEGGFIVHAGNALVAYSTEQEQGMKLTLEDGPRWAATVVPQGREIHLQRIHDDNRAEGEWLNSNSLRKLREQNETAGITSASDEGVVIKLAHCVQLQNLGETPRNLYCEDPSHLGLPMFLTNSEVLSVYGKGFTVWSTSGKRLWSREISDGRPVDNQKRAMNGNRFGILVTGRLVFDQISVPANHRAILVYDRAKQSQIFHAILGREAERVDFELSPDGTMLAVLVDDSILIYKIPA